MSDMFEGESKTPATPEGVTPTSSGQPAVDNSSILLDAIVDAEGKRKYADVSKALASIPHKEAYISKLETENKFYREENARLKDEIARITTRQESLEAVKKPAEGDVGQTPTNPIDLTSLIDQHLTARQQEEARKANQMQVLNKLKEMYGSEAESKWKAKAEELGVSSVFLTDVAGKSPKAVLAYFNQPQSANAPKPTSGSVNTEALKGSPTKPVPNIFSGNSVSKSVQQMREIRQEILSQHGIN